MAGSVPFIDRVPNYEIRDGVMHIWAEDWSMCMALRTFRQGMARADRVLREYEARCAEVVPLKRQKRG